MPYTYNALLKGGIALLSYYNVKLKSMPGHHVKLIEIISKLLQDDLISDIGNVMRSKRNLDLYSGGIDITEKESKDYLKFVEDVVIKISKIIQT